MIRCLLLSNDAEKRSYVFQLDLSQQRLRELPLDIGKLNKVAHSFLFRGGLCRAVGEKLLLIASAFLVHVTQVDRLDLSHNDLSDTSLTEELFELHNLKDLDISHNHFTKLPSCLCMFLDLERINITGGFHLPSRMQ